MDSVWRRLVGLEWIQHYRECGYRHPLSMRSSLLRVCRTLWREERGRLWDDLGKRYLQSSPEYATLVVMFEVEVRRMVAKATRFCEGELNAQACLAGGFVAWVRDSFLDHERGGLGHPRGYTAMMYDGIPRDTYWCPSSIDLYVSRPLEEEEVRRLLQHAYVDFYCRCTGAECQAVSATRLSVEEGREEEGGMSPLPLTEIMKERFDAQRSRVDSHPATSLCHTVWSTPCLRPLPLLPLTLRVVCLAYELALPPTLPPPSLRAATTTRRHDDPSPFLARVMSHLPLAHCQYSASPDPVTGEWRIQAHHPLADRSLSDRSLHLSSFTPRPWFASHVMQHIRHGFRI